MLQAFGPFKTGEHVSYEGREIVPRDDWVEYSFSARTHAGRVVLSDGDRKDAMLLERLHEYLGR